MDLARPSNVGSLIGAVMVALLGLAANYYLNMDPQVLQSFLPQAADTDIAKVPEQDGLEKEKEKFSLRFWEPLRRANAAESLSPEQIRKEALDRIKVVQAHLLESSNRQRLVGQRLSDEELSALVQVLDQLCSRMEADEDASESQRKEACLSRLYGLYVAADMSRASFADQFHTVAEEAIHHADETVVSHATALKLLHDLDFQHPDQTELFAKLRDFTNEFPTSEVGVYVFSIASRELWRHAHRELAEDVLRLGIQTYAGQRGSSRLMNQLLDQKRLP